MEIRTGLLAAVVVIVPHGLCICQQIDPKSTFEPTIHDETRPSNDAVAVKTVGADKLSSLTSGLK